MRTSSEPRRRTDPSPVVTVSGIPDNHSAPTIIQSRISFSPDNHSAPTIIQSRQSFSPDNHSVPTIIPLAPFRAVPSGLEALDGPALAVTAISSRSWRRSSWPCQNSAKTLRHPL